MQGSNRRCYSSQSIFDENGELAIVDMVQVALETVEDRFGETKLSREKAKRAESWKMLEEAHESQEIVTGIINGKVKVVLLSK